MLQGSFLNHKRNTTVDDGSKSQRDSVATIDHVSLNSAQTSWVTAG